MTEILECLLGLGLAAMLLRDVFDTVVVPGRTRGLLKVTRRVAFGGLKMWHRHRREPVGVGFAPTVLLVSFVVWMLLMVLAFGLMAHALRDSFSPPLDSFGDAAYVAGGAITTIGSGMIEARGFARGVVVGAGFCGLAVVTMGVTYLLQVQGDIAVRDRGVLKISTESVEPPSALALLERYAALGMREELPRLLGQGRDWCAAVLQSHASHPSLIYFRSASVEAGWPSTLGALMDLALMGEMLLDQPGVRGPAVLLHEEADRLARELVRLLELEPEDAEPRRDELRQLAARLRAAGYALRAGADAEGFARTRAASSGRIACLSAHLGAPPAPLVPDAAISP